MVGLNNNKDAFWIVINRQGHEAFGLCFHGIGCGWFDNGSQGVRWLGLSPHKGTFGWVAATKG
ncbi:hypothetical protein Tco_0745381, partial [Tanacetum coccineum]